MSGHVLIIDALTNRRIRLRAQLDTAAYEVEVADNLQEGLNRIQGAPPDVLIVADDLPGLRLRQMCKVLRANRKTQLTTIMVAVAHENHSARVSALIAGAHDVIDQHSDAADLKARLRNFMRIKHDAVETRSTPDGLAHRGLAEAVSEFRLQTTVAVVQCGGQETWIKHRKNWEQEAGINLVTLTPDQVRRSPDGKTDVFVLVERGTTDTARDLLSALRAHPDSRNSRILFVTDRSAGSVSPLDLGAHDLVPTDLSSKELALRIQRLARQKQDADRARAAASELEEKAYTDALTKLKNRQAADEYLIRTDRLLRDNPRPLAVLIADVDHFKAINDSHGHAAGDAALAHIASVLSANLRTSDYIARFGGEEFLIVLPDAGAGQARSVARRLRDAVARSSWALDRGTHVRVTISIGMALTSRSERKTTIDLCRAADIALYSAKRNGRNRIEMATARDFEAVLPQRTG